MFSIRVCRNLFFFEPARLYNKFMRAGLFFIRRCRISPTTCRGKSRPLPIGISDLHQSARRIFPGMDLARDLKTVEGLSPLTRHHGQGNAPVPIRRNRNPSPEPSLLHPAPSITLTVITPFSRKRAPYFISIQIKRLHTQSYPSCNTPPQHRLPIFFAYPVPLPLCAFLIHSALLLLTSALPLVTGMTECRTPAVF